MSGKGESTRIIAELTADGQRGSKPVAISSNECKVSDLLREGRNKFRRKYSFVACSSSSSVSEEIYLRTDDDLRRVLQLRLDGDRPRFRLTDAAPPPRNGASYREPLPIERRNDGGIVFVIGNEEDTEDGAIEQLRSAGKLEGCAFAIGMPDLHAGRGVPIGAAIMTREGVAYPQLVDGDIGCGMSFVETAIGGGRLNANRLRKIADGMRSIDCPYYASAEEAIAECSQTLRWGARVLEPLPEIEPRHHYEKLGTVGGGNHFAELQEFEDVIDPEACARYGIDVDRVHLLVHSGSRSLGSHYLGEFCDEAAKTTGKKRGPYPVDTDSSLFRAYLENHDVAINFAARNRRLIAKRLLEQLTPGGRGGGDPRCKFDIVHNFLERIEINSLEEIESMAGGGMFPKSIPPINEDAKDDEGSGKTTVGWIHRKGATPTTQSKILIIPGSRGSLSYLVEVNDRAQHGSGYSLAHGAGRRLPRSTALKRHRSRYPNPRALLQTEAGGVVVCEKKDLVYEEAPASYKDIDSVVGCLAGIGLGGGSGIGADGEGRGLVRVLATLRPILTYKYKDPNPGPAKCCR